MRFYQHLQKITEQGLTCNSKEEIFDFLSLALEDFSGNKPSKKDIITIMISNYEAVKTQINLQSIIDKSLSFDYVIDTEMFIWQIYIAKEQPKVIFVCGQEERINEIPKDFGLSKPITSFNLFRKLETFEYFPKEKKQKSHIKPYKFHK